VSNLIGFVYCKIYKPKLVISMPFIYNFVTPKRLVINHMFLPARFMIFLQFALVRSTLSEMIQDYSIVDNFNYH
jgi:hypothetical protein